MPSPSLNGSGFQVSVMPQLQAIDPRQFAPDPSQFASGALDATKVLGAFQQLKAQRDQMAEQAATRDARIAQIQAASDQTVLNRDYTQQTQGAKIGGELADLNLKAKVTANALNALPFEEKIAALDRQGKLLESQGNIDNYQKNTEQKQALIKSQIDHNNAEADRFHAEADHYRAAAAAAGVKPDKARDAWLTKIGDLASVVGITPEKAIQLYDSNPQLAIEASLLSESIKKHEFFIDPVSSMSPALKAALGQDGVQKVVNYAALEQHQNDEKAAKKSTGPLRDESQSSDASPAAAKPSGSPAIIKIDAKGNITTPGQVSGGRPPEKKPISESVGNAAETGGILSAMALANPGVRTAIGNAATGAGKLATRLWNGRSAAGQFTGRALKTLPSRSLGQFAANGVGSAVLPVTALYEANKGLGSLLSDKDTGQMTALQGIATAANTPSFDQQAQEAKYDELTQRIQMVVRSNNLSEDQKNEELHKLLPQRDLIYTLMNRGD